MTKPTINRSCLLVLIALCLAVSSENVHAQGMEDQSLGGTVGRSSEFASPSRGLPISQVISILKSQGYSSISNLSSAATGGGALQAIAIDPDGTPVSLMIDPMTAAILSTDPL